MSDLYYVTVARDTRVRIAAGPFESHAAAEAQVEPVRALMVSQDLRAHFDGVGVTKASPRPGYAPPVGRLNPHLDIEVHLN